MKKAFTYPLILILLILIACQPAQEKKETNDLKIMAYYVPSSVKGPEHLPLDKLTHIIFSFTEVIDHRMDFPYDQLALEMQKLVTASEKYPDLKVMVACGGWGGSGGFSDMAANAENRKVFVDSVIEFIKKYNIDGLDLDWEYPGLPGNGNPHSPDDKDNFTLLVKELRQAMDNYKPGLELTFAAAGWERYFDFIDLAEVMKSANYINMMTYDLTGGGAPVTGHHTNLKGLSLEQVGDTAQVMLERLGYNYQRRSADDIIQYCIEKGVSPQQIVIGGAFYGKYWKGVDPMNNGLFQKHKGFAGTHSYARLKLLQEKDPNYQRYWDDQAEAPYIYHQPDSLFITYEDPESLQLKTRYAIDSDLGGIMFWQLSQDTQEYELLNAIYSEARN